MRSLFFTLLTILPPLLVPGLLRAQERFKPGQWEIIYTGDNPHTSTTCLTPASTSGVNGTAESVRAAAEKSAAARKFTMKDYSFDGTTLSMTLISADRTFVNKASYHGDTFESVIITKTKDGEFTTRQNGRRLGACP